MAIGAGLIGFLVLAALFTAIKMYLEVPKESYQVLLWVAIATGTIPVVLLVLDYLAGSGVVVKAAGVQVGFLRSDIEEIQVRSGSIELPANFGLWAAPVGDSKVEIVEALKEATTGQIALIDVRDGNAWWVSRLLALCAGAAALGQPRCCVFVGMRNGEGQRYFGWAYVGDVVRGIVRSETKYRDVFIRSQARLRQLEAFPTNDCMPQLSPPPLKQEPGSHSPQLLLPLRPPDASPASRTYQTLGAGAIGHLIIEESGIERDPERLTWSRLDELVGHCSITAKLDTALPLRDQVARVLLSGAEYVALLENEQYKGVVPSDKLARLVLRDLLLAPEVRAETRKPETAKNQS